MKKKKREGKLRWVRPSYPSRCSWGSLYLLQPARTPHLNLTLSSCSHFRLVANCLVGLQQSLHAMPSFVSISFTRHRPPRRLSNSSSVGSAGGSGSSLSSNTAKSTTVMTVFGNFTDAIRGQPSSHKVKRGKSRCFPFRYFNRRLTHSGHNVCLQSTFSGESLTVKASLP